MAPFWYAAFFLRYELGAWAEQVRALSGASPAAYGVASYFYFMVGDVPGAIARARDGILAAPSSTHPETVICWQCKISCDAALGLSDQVHDDIPMYTAAAAGVDDAYTAAVEFALVGLFASDPQEAAALRRRREGAGVTTRQSEPRRHDRHK